jgi:hypothetical protein
MLDPTSPAPAFSSGVSGDGSSGVSGDGGRVGYPIIRSTYFAITSSASLRRIAKTEY